MMDLGQIQTLLILSYPNKEFGFGPSQIQIQIQINAIQKKLLLLAAVLLEKWDSLIKLTAYWYSPRLHKSESFVY